MFQFYMKITEIDVIQVHDTFNFKNRHKNISKNFLSHRWNNIDKARISLHSLLKRSRFIHELRLFTL